MRRSTVKPPSHLSFCEDTAAGAVLSAPVAITLAAAWIDFTMLWYPVQRQRLPSSPTRISRSVGFGLRSSSCLAAMIIPGVQKPHCRPCSSQNACCRGCKVVPLARPSMVVISAPSAWTAKMVQDLTLCPSTSTVHAPQLLVPQPTWVPVSPASSRMYCTSSSRGSTSCSCLAPLMVTATLRLIRTSYLRAEPAATGIALESARVYGGVGRLRVARLGAPELDAPAVSTGEQLDVEDALTNLSPLPHQCRPSAAHAADPEVLDPK